MQRVAQGDASPDELREVVSELGTAEIFGRRKDGSSAEPGLFSRAISAAINAARDAKDVRALGKMRAFINAIKTHFQGVFGVMKALREAKAAGKAEDFSALIDKLTGQSEQTREDKARLDELNKLTSDVGAEPEYREPTAEEQANGIAFSLSKIPEEERQKPLSITLNGQSAILVPPSFSLTAHHGTPHEVDKFSLDKIGTGEGAQVYGWGLYFAENKAVAAQYAHDLWKARLGRKYQMDAAHRAAVKDAAQIRNWLEGKAPWPNNTKGAPVSRDWLEKELREREEDIGRFKAAADKIQSNLYTVHLAVEPEELLDWDKPLDEQSEKVKAALARVGVSIRPSGERGGQPTAIVEGGPFKQPTVLSPANAETLYSQMSSAMSPAVRDNGWNSIAAVQFSPSGIIRNGDQAASEMMRKAGIPGIRYLDQNSRGRGDFQREGDHWLVTLKGGTLMRVETEAQARALAESEGSGKTYNYVIFDSSKIRITHRNGEVVNSGPSFSLSPSTPERDARPIEPIQIPSEELKGETHKDFRDAVRGFIAKNLQGQSLLNADTGWKIGFNSESKKESVGKLHKEPHFRAAMQVVPIVEKAVLLGDSKPAKSRENDTERFHYFAIPVSIDGHEAVAWFNTRKSLRGSAESFYEFGLYDPKKAAQTSQSLGAVSESQPNNSTLGPAKTVGEFITSVKDTLPAAIKVAKEPSFSLSPARQINLVQQRVDEALARDPERRREFGRAAAGKLAKLGRDWASDRQTWKGDAIKAVAEPRSKVSLDKEQAFREADAADRLEEAGMAKLTPATHAALDHGTQLLHDGVVGGTLLNEIGRLRSRTEALKRSKSSAQEYDDAPWLPAKFYGGTIMPDEAAQIMHDMGLLREPTPSALWEALGHEVKSIQARNKKFNEASQAAAKIREDARMQAKQQAADWRKQADTEQAEDHNPKARLLRSMRIYNSVLSVLPPELRGRMGGFIRLAELSTDEARVKEIGKRIEKAGGLVEKYLQKEYGEALKANQSTAMSLD